VEPPRRHVLGAWRGGRLIRPITAGRIAFFERSERRLLRDDVGSDEPCCTCRLSVLDPEANVIKATALISGLS